VKDCLNGHSFRSGTLDQAIADWDTLCHGGDPLAPLPAKAHLLGRGALKLTASKAKGRSLAEHPFWDAAQALADTRAAASAACQRARLQLLRRLFQHGPAALQALKRERRVVAFDDMLANLHDRLVAPGSALPAAVRERFPAALIDEFQDTDPLQFRIFEQVYLVPEAQDAPLFFVGDPKQAIYSFRNADLPTYLRAASLVAHRHTLGENQRSTAELIAALNGLFSATRRPSWSTGCTTSRSDVAPGRASRCTTRAGGPARPCSCGRCRSRTTAHRGTRPCSRHRWRAPRPPRSPACCRPRNAAISRWGSARWAAATSPCWCAPTPRAR
jgi:ATP-dependent exoDNAse (exonuclease V) beta subunit